MDRSEPIYRADNCRAAYQLNWSLAIFWNSEAADPIQWLDTLRVATEPDGVRILEHRLAQPRVSQFLISTRPEVAPPEIVRSIKGRLQHLVRGDAPRAFRRNYGLYSIGDVRRDAVEEYVRTQLARHVMADARVQAALVANQIANPATDLSAPRFGGHGQFIYNLHVVLVNQGHLPDVREQVLSARSRMVRAAADRKGHLLSSAAIVPDHIHLTLGCGLIESPLNVALGYLNNLTYVEGMKPVYQFGFYVGTFGKYDLNAVRRRLR
jgi:REP element-mobilizing transposase RayT